MMSNNPPSAVSAHAERITATLDEQRGQRLFQLAYRSEVVPLVDSGSLNRWAAVGIVDRHKIQVLADGVDIDGRHILYSDPRAIALLESILNRAPSSVPPSPRPRAAASADLESPVEAAAHFHDSIHVTRDGFEFHVTYRTRFGENKTDNLEPALETLQKMRVFKPHINMQKSGIRLVVTRWDGESFIEEHGIENLEHAQPDEVEALIKANVVGGSSATTGPASRSVRPEGRAVVRLEVVKKGHDSRFHLVYHRQDGSVDEGPLLIRPNLGKLTAERLFRHDVAISITALNDRLVLEQNEPESSNRRADSFPLHTIEEAAVLERALNNCLRPPEPARAMAEGPPVEDRAESLPSPSPVSRAAPSAPARAIIDAPLPVRPMEPPHFAAEAKEEAEGPAAKPAAGETGDLPSNRSAPPAASMVEVLLSEWGRDLFQSLESMNHDDLNGAVFTAVHQRFKCQVGSNDHDLPAFSLDWPAKEGGSVRVELVLAPHYLLCQYPFGYARFGLETRLFLTRLDDYVSFPEDGLRGAVWVQPSGPVLWVVSDGFLQFVQGRVDRSYRTQFGELFISPQGLALSHELIWPLSREQRLFEKVAMSAREYGLPVTGESVVLNPSGPEFIGFKLVAGNGMEFRDGDDFVRFTPVEFVCLEEGNLRHQSVKSLLRGWALDGEGRVCALHRSGSGFVPPDVKLVRLLSESEAEHELKSLNLLALLE